MNFVWIAFTAMVVGLMAVSFSVGRIAGIIHATDLVAAYKPAVQDRRIVAITPDSAGVTCYWYAGAMSCVKVKP